jgi:hypothetical protein
MFVRYNLKIVLNLAVNKFIFILALFFLFSFSVGFSQDQQPKPTRQSALDAFSRGDFGKANIQFTELLSVYPKDPLYMYYCGVSLVKLERDPDKALSLLKEAQKESAAIKAIPSDELFYLGRAEQMSGDFSEALKYFKSYTDLVGKKIAKENSAPQFIQQCIERKGEISKNSGFNEVTKNDSVQTANNEYVKLAKIINTNISDSILIREKSPSSEYEILINRSLNYQFTADSLRDLSDLYHKQYDKLSASEKPLLKTKISEADKLADINQKLANEKILAAESLKETKYANEGHLEKKLKSDSAFVKNKIIPVVDLKKSEIENDSLFAKTNITTQKKVVQVVDNHVYKDTINQLVTRDVVAVSSQKNIKLYSVFEVVAKPVYSANEKVPINQVVPEGLIYRIQLAVFRNPVDLIYFKGITPVYGFKNSSSDMTNYYAGMFRKSEDATKALVKVRTAGFKDAFVVALLDKKIISAERAGILEKEWGHKPLDSIPVQKIPILQKDTVPPTLIFRVEVIRTQKPLNSDQFDNIKKLAGNRGLDIIKNDSGQGIYLIGKFLTFESAAEYADLLARNGQKEAKVVAYLGKREIPVETAKQLFDKF